MHRLWSLSSGMPPLAESSQINLRQGGFEFAENRLWNKERGIASVFVVSIGSWDGGWAFSPGCDPSQPVSALASTTSTTLLALSPLLHQNTCCSIHWGGNGRIRQHQHICSVFSPFLFFLKLMPIAKASLPLFSIGHTSRTQLSTTYSVQWTVSGWRWLVRLPLIFVLELLLFPFFCLHYNGKFSFKGKYNGKWTRLRSGFCLKVYHDQLKGGWKAEFSKIAKNGGRVQLLTDNSLKKRIDLKHT